MRTYWLAFGLLLTACGVPDQDPIAADIPFQERQSGYAFLTEETQALQDDPFANPGLLWVDRGAALFTTSAGSTPACATCHEDQLTGVAARYPRVDPASGELFNLEKRINQCRSDRQTQTPWPYESDPLLAITAFVAHQSRDVPISIDTETPEAQAYLQQGRDYFTTRRGQFNLSCQQCHVENWGKQLRGDTISQGYGNGFPAYRFEWQSVGSLQRRLRDCDTGVRAEPLPYGDPTYLALELYLATRAEGLPIESPAVRR